MKQKGEREGGREGRREKKGRDVPLHGSGKAEIAQLGNGLTAALFHDLPRDHCKGGREGGREGEVRMPKETGEGPGTARRREGIPGRGHARGR